MFSCARHRRTCTGGLKALLEVVHHLYELPLEVSWCDALVFHVRWCLAGDEDHFAGALDGNDACEIGVLVDTCGINPFYHGSHGSSLARRALALMRCRTTSSFRNCDLA